MKSHQRLKKIKLFQIKKSNSEENISLEESFDEKNLLILLILIMKEDFFLHLLRVLQKKKEFLQMN